MVEAEGNPGALGLKVDGIEAFDFKPREEGDVEWCRWRCGGRRGEVGTNHKLNAGRAAFLGSASIVEAALGEEGGVAFGEFDTDGRCCMYANSVGNGLAIDFEGTAAVVFVYAGLGRGFLEEFCDLDFTLRPSDAGLNPISPIVGSAVAAVIDFQDEFLGTGNVELDIDFVARCGFSDDRAGERLGSGR